MKFPQYRKYKNGFSYFKIESTSHFTEYKTLGSKIEVYHFEAKILPDRNFISDMLVDYEMHWDLIEQDEFDKFIKGFQKEN